MKNFASCGSCLNRYSSQEKLDNQKKTYRILLVCF
ncbi:hypothetical protein BAMTA208_02510 [Bacillus amyloliquefaciens TA208]|nr:hypothetical protein BAMTA208_02510 [Bacillus amyloliquefaciens TA208]